MRKMSAFGKISCSRSWNEGGSAAAVFVSRRTLSKTPGLFIATSVAYTVGTPGNVVTSSCSIRRSVCAGKAKERSSTSVPPIRIAISSW
jgi:hypothetical protein